MALPTPKRRTEIPEQTVRVARCAFPKGNKYMRLRDELGEIYTDEQFGDLFSWKGETATAPGMLAMVCIMQFMENLSDVQTAEAVRSRIDWKYALGLELEDKGFDASVLTLFRQRLLAGGAEARLLDHLLELCRAKDLVRVRGRQRTDATHILMAVREVNRMELVGESVRQALERVAQEAPAWLRIHADPQWFQRYSHRMEQARYPEGKAAQSEFCLTLGRDGYRLFSALYADGEMRWLCDTLELEAMRRIWVQQFYRTEQEVCWRQSGNLPSGAEMINSCYDLEARYSEKRGQSWVGYKCHMTETCDPQTPHLITQVQTTPAPVPDCEVVGSIHQALADKNLLPTEHLMDGGYIDIENVRTSQAQFQVSLVGPSRQDQSWQARDQTGYDLSAFTIDWQAQQVTCPTGKTSQVWSTGIDKHSGRERISVRFAQADCQPCPARLQCTKATHAGRGLSLHSQPDHDLLQQLRAQELQPDFHPRYQARAGIEGTFSTAVRSHGLRSARYIGLAKTHLQHLFQAAAINLSRLADWFWADRQLIPIPNRRATTRLSHLAAMAAS